MKFTVTCLVSSVNSSLLSEAEAVTKEVLVANPRATIQNLRATVAIRFRLNVVAFDFLFDRHDTQQQQQQSSEANASVTPAAAPGSSSSTVDLSDEKQLLTDCGLQDGDFLKVVPKNYQPPAPGSSAAVSALAAMGLAIDAAPPTKRTRVEAGGENTGLAGVEGVDGEHEEDSVSDEEGEESDEEGDDEDDEDDAETAEHSDLFAALRAVVPDLNVLREEFLANPQAVMERIERNHPSLFQVITQNQETFIMLMNNEQLTKATQRMLHGRAALGGDGGDDDGDEDEEFSVDWDMGGEEDEDEEEVDEETAEQMNALLQSYIAAGGAGGDFDAADLAALEASGMQVGDVDEDDGHDGEAGDGGEGQTKRSGRTPKSDKEFILARVPSEEDEKKIQALTELGFSYDQCKLAFYMCHRSIDRASNMLFEAPPQL